MKIFVKAKPKSRENKVEKIDDQHFTISVKEPPIDNKANIAIMELLSEYFNVPISSIGLISGRTSKNKVFDIR
ncbi:MAG: DUF167 domain-containing protein [Candidatus Paceibacterota bacterium]|jgi:hypothetical protein